MRYNLFDQYIQSIISLHKVFIVQLMIQIELYGKCLSCTFTVFTSLWKIFEMQVSGGMMYYSVHFEFEKLDKKRFAMIF